MGQTDLDGQITVKMLEYVHAHGIVNSSCKLEPL